MTAPEADYRHNQHPLPVTFPLRTKESREEYQTNSHTTTSQLTNLNQQVCDYYSAHTLQGIHTEDVFQYLTSAISQMYVTGIKELVKTGEAHGYETELQFFRCTDRNTVAPVALTFKKIAADGSILYGLPNVTAILDSPEERLRGDNSSLGKKITRATDGCAEDGEDATFGGKVIFETFSTPARVLLSESTDSELHRPFDLVAQYDPESEVEAVVRMKNALTNAEEFSFLAECVVHPYLTQFLSRYSQLFGAREKADITSVLEETERTVTFTALDPENREGPQLLLHADIQFFPFASVTISQSDEYRERRDHF